MKMKWKKVKEKKYGWEKEKPNLSLMVVFPFVIMPSPQKLRSHKLICILSDASMRKEKRSKKGE